MKLDKYVAKLKDIQFKFGVSPMCLLILNQVLDKAKTSDEVTIMNIIETNPHASQATTHKHLQTLIRQKVLIMQGTTDGRKKVLVKGKRFDDLAKFVAEA